MIIVIGRIDIARIDAEEVHIVSSVPRRGPEDAVVALMVSLTGVEVAGERRRESGLKSRYLTRTTTAVLTVEILEFTS